MLYQKDGTGNLFRLYLDRIHAPETLAQIRGSVHGSKKFTGLVCSRCNTSIGVPMVYQREGRPAFRLVPGAIVKQKSDGTLLSQCAIDEKDA